MKHIQVGELGQAQHLLEPILGKNAAIVFGIALLFSGISSTTTAGMAGGSIIAGMFKVMRQYKNSLADKTVLWMIGIIVSVLNIMLLASYIYVLIYENRSLNISIKQEIPT
ncbi:MAG: divalent metal cation transporter [Firmicutes bacterium]|nr:divalent metal cation transporter [Bacillota bacterium]